MALTRKQFIRGALAAAAAGLLGCSGSDEVGSELRGGDGFVPPSDLGDGDDGGKGDDLFDGDGDSSGSGNGGAGTGDEGLGGQGGAGQGGAGQGGAGQGGSGQGGAGGPMCGDDGTGTPDHPWHPPIDIPLQDIVDGVDKDYEVPSQNHAHWITVTAADFAALAQNGSVTVTSTQSHGHSHQVVLTCDVVAP